MKRPGERTTRQIYDVMVREFGANCLRQIESNGDLIEFWNIDGHVVITHAYSGEYGWTHYLPSKTGNLKKGVKEIREHLDSENVRDKHMREIHEFDLTTLTDDQLTVIHSIIKT